jgi:predicted MarR family transcription regulator
VAKNDSQSISAAGPPALRAERDALSAEMSELEVALVVLINSFYRWVDHCAATAGVEDLSTMDLLVVHFIIHRKRPMTVSAIAFALSIQETHLVTYSAKKLARLGMLKGKRSGKEVLYHPTKLSETQYARYVEVRQAHLIRSVAGNPQVAQNLDSFTGKLRALSAIYDQASRSIASS